MNEAEVVLDEAVPADRQAAKAEEPGKEAFDVPASSIATKHSAVLRARSRSVPPVRGNQRDATLLSEAAISGVAVVRLVANDQIDGLGQELLVERRFDKVDLGPGGAVDVDGERKAVAIDDRHDLNALAALRVADGEPPFFAAAKAASMNDSAKSSIRCSRRSSASASTIRRSAPERTHSWKRRWHVWYGGYALGSSAHCEPVRRTQKTASKIGRSSRRVRPGRSFRLGFGRARAMMRATRFHWSSVSRMAILSHKPLTDARNLHGPSSHAAPQWLG